jgi:KDO2-lipid IV(A) lauroyltransferase
MSWEERRDLALFRLMRALPVRAASGIGARLGQSLGRRAHPAAAARVKAALRHLRNDLAADPAALELAQESFWSNVGRMYAEFCILHKIVAGGRVGIDDMATFDAVLSAGRPVILAYAHLGNWESAGADIARRVPGRICAFAAPLPANRARAQIAAMQRSRSPARVILTDRMAWRHALDHLESPGGIFYVALDEVTDGNATFPCFGREPDMRGNLSKIVRIAARTGAIVAPIYSERLPGGRFCTHVLTPMEFSARQDIDSDATHRRMKQLDSQFEPAVLRLIEQWFGLLDFRP